MESYFCLLLYTLLMSGILSTKLKEKKEIYLLFTVIPMILVACLRNDVVGTDLSMYIGIYSNAINNLDYYVDVLRIEQGYMVLAYIVNYLTSGSEIAFLLVIAIITYGGIFYSFKKVSKNILISVLIFQCMAMYCTSFNLIKQYIAVAIFSLSYCALIRDKYKTSVLLCLFGSFFHRSCLVLIPFIFIYKILKGYKRYYLLMLIVILWALICVSSYEFLISYVPKYHSLYLETEYGSGRTLGASFYLGVIAISFLIYDIVKTYYDEKPFDKLKGFNNILILSYGLVWMLSYKIFIIHRLAPYFEILLCFSIPYIIEKQKRSKLIVYFVFVNLLFVYYYIFLSKNLGNVVPYVMRI